MDGEIPTLNVIKAKYTLFHKKWVTGSIPLKLPDLKIANNSIKKISSVKLSGIMIDENIACEDHIQKSRATVSLKAFTWY